MRIQLAALSCLATLTAWTIQSAAQTTAENLPLPGSVNAQAGLEAWGRVFQVASHPRCANCHTGASDVPMWSGPSYGEPKPHGMRIRAGESRIGAEYLQCSTCHSSSEIPQLTAHAPPRVGTSWRLAPVEADWFGRSSEEICAQLGDPALNGGRDYLELADHLGHDVILHWAWSPGSGREPAPFSLDEHVLDMHIWGAAGQPCPQD